MIDKPSEEFMVNYTSGIQKVESNLETQMNKTAKEIMIRSVETLKKEMSITQACDIIDRHNMTGAPVCDEKNKLIGFLSQKDCLKFILDLKYYNDGPKSVGNFMSKTVMTVHPSESILYLAELFLKNNYQMYPVLDDEGIFLGVITRSILFREISKMSQTSW